MPTRQRVILLLCIAVTITGCSSTKETPFVTVYSNFEQDYFQTKIDHLEFDEVPIEEALRTLAKLWQAKHPGIHLPKIMLASNYNNECENGCVCNDEETDDFEDSFADDLADDLEGEVWCNNDYIPRVSMVVDDISVLDSIKFICQTANLKYRKLSCGVIIKEKSVADDWGTEIYALSDGQIKALGLSEETETTELTALFKTYGLLQSEIITPTAEWDSDINRLIVFTMIDDHKKLKHFLEFIECQYLIDQGEKFSP